MGSPISLIMPASKTYAERLLVYTPLTDKIGVMQFVDKAKPTSKKAKVRRYAVLRESDREDGGIVFKLTKPKGKDQEAYHVCYRGGKEFPECTCKGFDKESYCSHVISIVALINKGVFGAVG